VLPRAIVGRSYRTGEVHSNITDSLQVQSLTWNIFAQEAQKSQFIGIGQCCTQEWCHEDCKNIDDGNLVLISFVPPSSFSVLADIGNFDPDTVRLGAEFSSPRSKPAKVYVYYQDTVISYDVVITNGVIVQTKQSNQTPTISTKIRMWFNPGMF